LTEVGLWGGRWLRSSAKEICTGIGCGGCGGCGGDRGDLRGPADVRVTGGDNRDNLGLNTHCNAGRRRRAAMVRRNEPHLPRHAVPAPAVTNHGRIQG
jgi:hypothetical protein